MNARYSPLAPKLRLDVSALGLGGRASHCLERLGVTTIEALVRYSEAELLSTPNLGATTLNEIQGALERQGLGLGLTSFNMDSPAFNSGRSHGPSEDRAVSGLLLQDIATLGLQPQAYNSLRRAGIHTVGDLMRHRKLELLHIPSIGQRVVNEIVDALHKNDLRLEIEPVRDASGDQVHSLCHRKLRSCPEPGRLSLTLDALGLRHRALNCLNSAGIATVEQLIALSAAELGEIDNLGACTLAEITSALASNGLELKQPYDDLRRLLDDGLPTVDDELALILDSAVNPSHKRVAEHRLGWGGRPVPTLHQLARTPSLSGLAQPVTRERIRQLETASKKRIMQALKGLCPPRAKAALGLILQRAPLSTEEVPHLLIAHGLSSMGLSWIAIQELSALATHDSRLIHLKEGMASLLLPEDSYDYCVSALKTLSSLTSNPYGTVSRVSQSIPRPEILRETAETIVIRLIDIHPGYEWLDRDAGIYWRVERKLNSQGNKVLFVCRKLFSVTKRRQLAEIKTAVERSRTVDGSFSEGLLLAMILNTPWLSVEGSSVYVDAGNSFSEVTDQDKRLFRATAGVSGMVQFKELRDGLVQQGMSSNHAQGYIACCPYLYPVDRGTYRLLVDRDVMQDMILEAEEAADLSEGDDGGLSLVITVTNRTLISRMARGIHGAGDGTWTVVDEAGNCAGSFATSGDVVHFGSTLHRMGATVGETYELEFSPSERKVKYGRVS